MIVVALGMHSMLCVSLQFVVTRIIFVHVVFHKTFLRIQVKQYNQYDARLQEQIFHGMMEQQPRLLVFQHKTAEWLHLAADWDLLCAQADLPWPRVSFGHAASHDAAEAALGSDGRRAALQPAWRGGSGRSV